MRGTICAANNGKGARHRGLGVDRRALRAADGGRARAAQGRRSFDGKQAAAAAGADLGAPVFHLAGLAVGNGLTDPRTQVGFITCSTSILSRSGMYHFS